MNENLTVNEAAKILGKSPNFIKMGIETGVLPIGSCVKLGRNNYHISRTALENYMKYGNRPIKEIKHEILAK